MKKSEKEKERLEEIASELSDTYIYVKSVAKYYWKEQKKFFSPRDVSNNIMCTNNELNWLRLNEVINTFDNICYYYWWREWCYNLLNEWDILQPSSTPILDSNIKTLIDTVCGFKNENIEYLHKAILYKYLNLNDFTIPAIVLYGAWWSWKWTLISLLSTILWNQNVLSNLWQQDLTSSFDTYKGQKLVVEFAEISTNNTNWDLRILNKLKNIIGAEKITVNEKWVQVYQIDNIAWFFISSNSNKPLQLDDRDKGNRRFTIIRSITKLKNWKSINKAIRNKEVVSNYLAWLLGKYPKVVDYKNLDALDNEDKRELEERSQSEANQFWEWMEENFPNCWKYLTKIEVELYIELYCDEHEISQLDFMKYFWHNSKYPKKKIRIWKKTYYWVQLYRTVEQ